MPNTNWKNTAQPSLRVKSHWFGDVSRLIQGPWNTALLSAMLEMYVGKRVLRCPMKKVGGMEGRMFAYSKSDERSVGHVSFLEIRLTSDTRYPLVLQPASTAVSGRSLASHPSRTSATLHLDEAQGVFGVLSLRICHGSWRTCHVREGTI
ncbi:hypothetical protein BCR34DRAFT_116430 [Clohesyomyces aquaticus]|uniref:Uncharacterized protein n=1 Tax=Clohesyomyces aquaticus TaxID=1231657 RepID=A0A1Y1YQ88_9PLEO|nr:hypothetical protein BCR34DRAFT_116430 [Clohesyomyces aquaticus]